MQATIQHSMKFGTVDIHNSHGYYLAHSLSTKEGRVSKGTLITPDIAEQLANNGISSIVVAKLETDDVHEDVAALTIAQALAGNGISLSKARTGRVNLLASNEGLCHFNAQDIVAANAVDEGITVATLPENQWVPNGRMVATVKIIPYGVKGDHLRKVHNIVSAHSLSVVPAKQHNAELIQTKLDSIKQQVLDKTRRVLENRLTPRSVNLTHESRCEHTVPSLLAAINKTLQRDPDWLLIAGASAISDRADVIPKAIIEAGGKISRYGIPVDPGNLLLLAHIGSTTVVGLPGCARSPRFNGLDMVIDRMACELPISDIWLSGLSVGGLLTEIANRPTPRTVASGQQTVGAVVLAAGSSRRAGSTNKLLFRVDQTAMVARVAQAANNSQADKVIAITGFEKAQVENALASTTVECHHNQAHASGMASSVIAGVAKMINYDAVVICLGDMPHVTSAVINKLIGAFKTNPDKSIFLPVNNNRRGNPVLFSKVFFDTLLTLKGDTGARTLVQQYADEVCEVIVDDDGILVDYDTQQELDKLKNERDS